MYFEVRLGKSIFEPMQIPACREGFSVNVPLKSELSEDKIQITCKTQTEIVGSVSIP